MRRGHTLISEPITATGGNDNEVEAYAVRGALTNALGAAFAKLTWQLPVYKGQLSHRNAATFGENGKKPIGNEGRLRPRNPLRLHPLPRHPPPTATAMTPNLDALLNYVIPSEIKSKHAGKKLSEVSAQVLEWYATKMAVTTPESQVLKDKAAALLALQLQPA